ncbi:MAG: sigma-70 family RNA polymerase sigma factor [Phycisphaerales bacterium]|nr:sigma-70 family RNA polymerase sigma factor [Planctomycetota bacterium]
MSEALLATKTTTRLLDALLEPANEPAWAQIDARYRPVISGLARRLGLRDADAEEVAQQALTEFVRVYREGRYDRSKGRLSSWILSIAHHTALRIARSSRKNLLPGATILNDTPDEQSLRTIWTDERDRTILSRAISILREESDVDDRTLQAFELVALRGVPAPEAATQAGMTVDQVYVAKSRMTKRLREVVAQLTEAFEEDV